MVPLIINAVSNPPNIVIQRSYQRRNAVIAETWWEKENLIVNNRPKTKKTLKNAGMTDINNDDIPSLRGWFLKEKRDKFKRHQSLIPGASSNRRWFTIERIPTGNKGGEGPSEEFALCYYKRSSSDKSQRCGWLFLNDVLSLSQDVPGRWITVEHPTRVLRMQSPTPAQHRVWFSTLSKCCRHVRRDVASPSSSPEAASGGRRPSLPYFAENSAQKARRDSLKEEKEAPLSTAKDELQFLREITGGGNIGPNKEPTRDLGMPIENDKKSYSSNSADTRTENGNDRGEQGLLAAQQPGRSNRPDGVASSKRDHGDEFDTKRSESKEPSFSPALEKKVRAETHSVGGLSINGKKGREEEKENPPFSNLDVAKRNSKAETSMSGDLRSRLASAIATKSLRRAPEERMEAEPLSYEARGFEETSGDGRGHFRSFRSSDASRFASSNDHKVNA